MRHSRVLIPLLLLLLIGCSDSERKPAAESREDYLLALDEALNLLSAQDHSLGRIVELRFFAGLTVKETAQAMDISERSVKRGWRLARAWLQSKINEDEDGS